MSIEEMIDQNYDSVEKSNKKYTDALGWDRTDVLYSFLGIYTIGLRVYCKDFDGGSLKRILSSQIEVSKNQNPNSRKFIKKFANYFLNLKEDNQIKDKIMQLNNLESLNEFIKVYTTVGNVIPIWPGGNEDRGTSGCYDIPDIYFNNEKVIKYSANFFKNLCSNSFIDDIFNSQYRNLTRESILNFSEKEFNKFLVDCYNKIQCRNEAIISELSSGDIFGGSNE